MKKFLVLYMAPASVLDDWAKTDPETRKAAEQKMMTDWDAWIAAHPTLTSSISGAGKTKRVTSSGVADVRNDIMLYSIAEGESHEEVAKAFEGHPHFGISQAFIEIMEVNPLPAK